MTDEERAPGSSFVTRHPAIMRRIAFFFAVAVPVLTGLALYDSDDDRASVLAIVAALCLAVAALMSFLLVSARRSLRKPESPE